MANELKILTENRLFFTRAKFQNGTIDFSYPFFFSHSEYHDDGIDFFGANTYFNQQVGAEFSMLWNIFHNSILIRFDINSYITSSFIIF